MLFRSGDDDACVFLELVQVAGYGGIDHDFFIGRRGMHETGLPFGVSDDDAHMGTIGAVIVSGDADDITVA